MLGGWLEDSGWTGALVQANVASPGTADPFVKASDITPFAVHYEKICINLRELTTNSAKMHS